METLMQFMVIKKNGTTTLITGIGDSKDFSFAAKLASWLGIVLNAYQSTANFYN